MGLVQDTHMSEGLPGERIAKVIARSGLCSRRDAERLIEEGRVTLNGRLLSSPAVNVSLSDDILVDGIPLPTTEPPRLWRFHKPKGRVTTHRDPEERPTVFDGLPETMPRVISVGRLDFNTEGLLLLTNDGELARHLERPATGWLRRYRVRANGTVRQAQLDALADGITIDGINYAGIEAKIDREQGTNVWLTVGLREGKNREVRRIMDHLGLIVNRLIRVSYGPFALGELEVGAVEEVKRRVLADQLGAEVAERLGLRERRQDRHDEGQEEAPRRKAVPTRPAAARKDPPKQEARTETRRDRPVKSASRRAGGEGDMRRDDRPPRNRDRDTAAGGFTRDRRPSGEEEARSPRNRDRAAEGGFARDRRPSGEGDAYRDGRPPRSRDRNTRDGDTRPARSFNRDRRPGSGNEDRPQRGGRLSGRGEGRHNTPEYEISDVRPWENRDGNTGGRPGSRKDARPMRGRQRDASTAGSDRDSRPASARPWKSRDRDAAGRPEAGSGERKPRARHSDARPTGERDTRPAGARPWKSRDRDTAGRPEAGGGERPARTRHGDARPTGERDRNARPTTPRGERERRPQRPSARPGQGKRPPRPEGGRPPRDRGPR